MSLAPMSRASERMLDLASEVLSRDRLVQQLSKPNALVERDLRVLAAAREVENLERWAARFPHPRPAEAVQAGHDHVGDHEIDPLVAVEDIERREPAIRRCDGMPLGCEKILDDIKHILVVVDNGQIPLRG